MVIHVVNWGDILWKIAKYYNSSVDRIVEVNNLHDPNKLLVGQSLLIPTDDTLYTIKYGDVLWRIAEKYGVSVENIMKTNSIINPNFLYPGTKITIPQREKKKIDVNGYIYMLGNDSVPIIEEVGDNLTYLSPFAYLIKEDGGLQGLDDMAAIKTAISENIVPMMAITNFSVTSKGENLAREVLNNPRIIQKLQTNIINIMKEKGYKGLNIDFENVLPSDREAYNRFLKSTVDIMHKEGFFVSTALAPKINKDQVGLLYEAHDYEAHGKIVDFVVLMTYEWGWRGGPPRAISPVNEMERVLDYAVTVIPTDKILMGFQIYARDWTLPFVGGREAETFSVQEAIDRAYKYKATIQYDVISQSPFYQYTDENGIAHEVWFEDARSAQAKFDLVKDYNLRGLSYWVLGYPFQQNWELLADNFTVRKR
ncbi:spore germination protein [Sedimentibacter acidaminivorans]|uniref:Spore germination protein n=1 Tax=Sedimentibacter acidaminivorans TaxID=913099 RepID=A0ABS4GHK3_9FIRM|nr:LysM peptidoglycan-binding domain-containing protein [Sedimentibacter acidaminivorans]MBP1927129.1 spore germination protein [Sedimentibacter acidaminivorans]